MQIKKALVTAAGFGTRFLPITKTIQKELLPIVNRPIIDFVVDDLVSAGVEEVIFVISEHNYQLIHYYRENLRLYKYLEKMNKITLYGQIENLHQKAVISFIKQKDSDPYGTGTPVKLAKKDLENEDAFFVFMGDDFLFSPEGKSESAKMMELFDKSHAKGLTTCIEKPTAELSRYGVVAVKSQNGYKFLDHIVEKPEPGKAPSNLVNISKYIFTPNIFEILAKQKVDQKSGELFITDTVTKLAVSEPVVIYTPSGEYLDGGHPLGWLKANLMVASADPAMKTELQHFARTKLGW